MGHNLNNLREQHTKYSLLQCSSSLAKTFLDVKDNISVEDNIAEQIKVLISWKTEASIGINELVKSLNEKWEKILDTFKSLVCLQAKMASKELLNALRRRIKQMTLTKNFSVNTQTTVNISCNNNCSLSGESAIGTLIEIENSNTSRWNRLLYKLRTISELIEIANLEKDSTAVSLDELLFYVPLRFKDLSIVANQLLSHLSFLLVKNLIVNILLICTK